MYFEPQDYISGEFDESQGSTHLQSNYATPAKWNRDGSIDDIER